MEKYLENQVALKIFWTNLKLSSITKVLKLKQWEKCLQILADTLLFVCNLKATHARVWNVEATDKLADWDWAEGAQQTLRNPLLIRLTWHNTGWEMAQWGMTPHDSSAIRIVICTVRPSRHRQCSLADLQSLNPFTLVSNQIFINARCPENMRH